MVREELAQILELLQGRREGERERQREKASAALPVIHGSLGSPCPGRGEEKEKRELSSSCVQG